VLSGGKVWLLEGQARAQIVKSASALCSDWPAFPCNFRLFRLRPDMAPLGMFGPVTPKALSPPKVCCLIVILYVSVLYVRGYDGVN